MCTWQKPGGAIALRAPTLGQECRQTWLLRKMFRWQCVLSVDLFRTCLHKVMTELIFNFSLHTTHNGVKFILKFYQNFIFFHFLSTLLKRLCIKTKYIKTKAKGTFITYKRFPNKSICEGIQNLSQNKLDNVHWNRRCIWNDILLWK